MTRIYHITHLRNLRGILARGGLCCDAVAHAEGLCEVSIAHAHIKERRRRRLVPAGPQGALADYVPFYFATRSPMLYTISRGNVAGYEDGQARVLYLVSSVERVLRERVPFVFSDGHADMELSAFYTDHADLRRVDWKIMRATYWHDTNEDPDRKRRRQAEFLVYQFAPWHLIEGIAVFDGTMLSGLEALLASARHRPQVRHMPRWYF